MNSRNELFIYKQNKIRKGIVSKSSYEELFNMIWYCYLVKLMFANQKKISIINSVLSTSPCRCLSRNEKKLLPLPVSFD